MTSAPFPEADALEITPQVRIPMHELVLTAISGGGPGGQHVNKSATRIALQWNVRTTQALRDEQRARVLTQLASRLDSEGQLRIVAGEYRSQQQNRRAALERFRLLLVRALVVPRVRKATKPSRGAVLDRLTDKRKRAETKRQRRQDHDE